MISVSYTHLDVYKRQDGRYSYSYTDLDKNRRTVYAKTLVELRAKERQYHKQILLRFAG